ncbi:MAG TPA: YARHG domain-containing protein [Aestuariivirga sp.]|jgi:hypothetical protein|nr:YARHG domain-containing protein [Aestuariivirga sp.]
MIRRAALSVLAAAALAASTVPAFANCYEIIGCDDSQRFTPAGLRQLGCQQLWEVRNMIYKQNGYCFATPRAIATFGNEGCFITSQSAVRLNAHERFNVKAIQKMEARKGCR